MIGGIVIEVVTLADHVYVDVRDTRYRDTCATKMVRNHDSESIEVGDQIWWQSRNAYWTPADGIRADVRIPRIGYSGRFRPAIQQQKEGHPHG